MAFISLGDILPDTGLKSLKYGHDREGGSSSNQPYIKKPFNVNLPPALNFLSNDFLLRGGVVGAPISSVTDVIRLGKYFADVKSFNGIAFTLKQNLLSRLAPRTEASGKILNEGVYTPLSTLAQAGVNAFGFHFNKQGLNPIPGLRGSIKTYQEVMGTYNSPFNFNNNNKFPSSYVNYPEVNPAYLSAQQSVDNYNLETYTRKVEGLDVTNDPINFNPPQTPEEQGIPQYLPPTTVQVPGKFTNRLLNLWYFKQYNTSMAPDIITYTGGPGSILGIGQTRIKFATDSFGAAPLRTGINNPSLPLYYAGFKESGVGDFSTFTRPSVFLEGGRILNGNTLSSVYSKIISDDNNPNLLFPEGVDGYNLSGDSSTIFKFNPSVYKNEKGSPAEGFLPSFIENPKKTFLSRTGLLFRGVIDDGDTLPEQPPLHQPSDDVDPRVFISIFNNNGDIILQTPNEKKFEYGNSILHRNNEIIDSDTLPEQPPLHQPSIDVDPRVSITSFDDNGNAISQTFNKIKLKSGVFHRNNEITGNVYPSRVLPINLTTTYAAYFGSNENLDVENMMDSIKDVNWKASLFSTSYNNYYQGNEQPKVYSFGGGKWWTVNEVGVGDSIAVVGKAYTWYQEDLNETTTISLEKFNPITSYNGVRPFDFRCKIRARAKLLKDPIQKQWAFNVLSTSPDYDEYYLEKRVNLGDPGFYPSDRNIKNYSYGYNGSGAASSDSYDKINALELYNSSGPDDINKPTNDLIQFRIAAIDSGGSSNKVYMHFRAFLGSITDNYTGNWDSMQYVGRGENFYTYKGFDRKVSLSFTVAAQSKKELMVMYRKLNYLASNLAPDYSEVGYMRGPLVSLTIGGYFYEQVGFITGLSFEMDENTPWEIGIDAKGDKDKSVKELAHIIKVTGFSFTPIHDFVPRKAQWNNLRNTPFISLTDGAYSGYDSFEGENQTSEACGDPIIKTEEFKLEKIDPIKIKFPTPDPITIKPTIKVIDPTYPPLPPKPPIETNNGGDRDTPVPPKDTPVPKGINNKDFLPKPLQSDRSNVIVTDKTTGTTYISSPYAKTLSTAELNAINNKFGPQKSFTGIPGVTPIIPKKEELFKIKAKK